jgi:hypothetical protein
VTKALQYFDLRINALALHFARRRMLDPFGVLQQAHKCDPGINWGRWENMPPLELAVLAIRLLKIMYESPSLSIHVFDKDRLIAEVLPKITEEQWEAVHQRFPLGRNMFLSMFATHVLGRVREKTD